MFNLSHLACAENFNCYVLQYAFNLFSHNSPMTENGYNEEEMKMVKETRKIWGQQDVDITATCIRVPIMRAHAESINLELKRDMSEDEVRCFSNLDDNLLTFLKLNGLCSLQTQNMEDTLKLSYYHCRLSICCPRQQECP